MSLESEIRGNIEKLSNTNTIVKCAALNALQDRAYHQINRDVLRNAGIIPPVVILLSDSNAEVKALAIDLLNRLIDSPDDKETVRAMRNTNVIPPVVQLLSNPNDRIKEKAASVLELLIGGIFGHDLTKDAIRNANGINPLILMLENTKARNASLCTLLSLIRMHEVNKTAFFDAKGLPAVIRYIHNGNYYGTAAEIIAELSMIERYKDPIREAGGITTLLLILNRNESSQNRVNDDIISILKALQYLTKNNPTNRDAVRNDRGILPIVKLLDKDSFCDYSRQYSARILWYLSHENQINKDAIRNAGGIDLLVKLLSSDREETRQVSISTLKSLIYQNENNKKAVANAMALPVLSRLAETESNEQTKKSCQEIVTFLYAQFDNVRLSNLKMSGFTLGF